MQRVTKSEWFEVPSNYRKIPPIGEFVTEEVDDLFKWTESTSPQEILSNFLSSRFAIIVANIYARFDLLTDPDQSDNCKEGTDFMAGLYLDPDPDSPHEDIEETFVPMKRKRSRWPKEDQ